MSRPSQDPIRVFTNVARAMTEEVLLLDDDLTTQHSLQECESGEIVIE